MIVFQSEVKSYVHLGMYTQTHTHRHTYVHVFAYLSDTLVSIVSTNKSKKAKTIMAHMDLS